MRLPRIGKPNLHLGLASERTVSVNFQTQPGHSKSYTTTFVHTRLNTPSTNLTCSGWTW